MNYKFYGHDTPNLKSINKDYLKIESQRHLYELLCDCWCVETCAPRLREKWSENNKTAGQCSITAFLVQDIFGADVYGVTLNNGDIHCFNRIRNIEFDLTSEQFKNEVLDYSKGEKQTREIHFQKKEKYDRYLLLKKKLLEKLK